MFYLKKLSWNWEKVMNDSAVYSPQNGKESLMDCSFYVCIRQNKWFSMTITIQLKSLHLKLESCVFSAGKCLVNAFLNLLRRSSFISKRNWFKKLCAFLLFCWFFFCVFANICYAVRRLMSIRLFHMKFYKRLLKHSSDIFKFHSFLFFWRQNTQF